MSIPVEAPRPPKALIVDDDSAAVKFIRDRCLKMGLEVQTASNGLQALIKARQDWPDVLIVDVHMPELDGLSLCSTLLEPGRKPIEVIVVSGNSEVAALDRCESLGATFASKGPNLWKTIRSSLHNIFPGVRVEFEEREISGPKNVRERPLILVIDDDRDVGKFLLSRLQKCGVDALFASDGLRGYQVAAREKPNVIISDCSMLEADINFLMWRLRSTAGLEKIPVFAITAYDAGPSTIGTLTKELSGYRGVERVFKKPLDIDALFLAIQEYCALDYKSWRQRGGPAVNLRRCKA